MAVVNQLEKCLANQRDVGRVTSQPLGPLNHRPYISSARTGSYKPTAFAVLIKSILCVKVNVGNKNKINCKLYTAWSA